MDIDVKSKFTLATQQLKYLNFFFQILEQTEQYVKLVSSYVHRQQFLRLKSVTRKEYLKLLEV